MTKVELLKDYYRRCYSRCKVIDGLGMIVNQGILGVKYWTGITADAGVMRDALAKVL